MAQGKVTYSWPNHMQHNTRAVQQFLGIDCIAARQSESCLQCSGRPVRFR